MKTVAIICEYNPFHNGHLYQIEEIKRQFSGECRIIGIMSGNFVQRGECSLLDKYKRASLALEAGVDLILELPFPFSASCAEIFGKSGVHIANSLGIVDVLSFGSESGSIEELISTAGILQSDDYKNALERLRGESSDLGYPVLCEEALKRVDNSAITSFTPNNILALEYLKALSDLSCAIEPHTVKRLGADFNCESFTDQELQSATAIRKSIHSSGGEWEMYVPRMVASRLKEYILSGECPCDTEKLSALIIGKLRLDQALKNPSFMDAEGGLYNRIASQAMRCDSYSELSRLCTTKTYTASRVKRAIINILFGVTSSEAKKLPLYTTVLAMNGVGKQMLKEIRKHGTIPILTKPSRLEKLSDEAKRQKLLSDRADSVFQMCAPVPKEGTVDIKSTPYVKD